VAAGIVSPVLVGRLGELSVLVRARERSATGEPGVVLVGGEAGVGKTRLVQEASALAESAGARVLTGACVELGGDRLPLAPLVDALRALARSSPEAELGALLGPARRDLARLLPELDPAAAAPDGETETSPTSQLVEIVLGLVERLAIERPLVLVLEDLHWADRATLELVEFLVRALRGVRVLLVGTYRSDELHRQHPLRSLLSGWNRVRSVERVELDRFDRDEVATQVAAILGAPPSSRLVELVLARSEGNAFLVEEIVRAVQNGADPGYLPPSLRDMLLVRAERLSDPAQRVLQTVAVAGRWVPDRLLAAVTAIGAHEQEADAQLTLGVARAYLGDAEAGLAALSAGLEWPASARSYATRTSSTWRASRSSRRKRRECAATSPRRRAPSPTGWRQRGDRPSATPGR
jgi:predicted ATPase